MARFRQIKSINPKLRHDQIAKKIGYSTSTLQRCTQDIKMLLLYKIQSNSHKRRQKISKRNLDDDSHREHDPIRPQMTSKDLKRLNPINHYNRKIAKRWKYREQRRKNR